MFKKIKIFNKKMETIKDHLKKIKNFHIINLQIHITL